MKNITVEQTRKHLKKHFFAKKFIPVFARVYEADHWWTPLIGKPRYTKHSRNYFEVTPTSIPKKVWPIARAKRRKQGQLELPI